MLRKSYRRFHKGQRGIGLFFFRMLNAGYESFSKRNRSRRVLTSSRFIKFLMSMVKDATVNFFVKVL